MNLKIRFSKKQKLLDWTHYSTEITIFSKKKDCVNTAFRNPAHNCQRLNTHGIVLLISELCKIWQKKLRRVILSIRGVATHGQQRFLSCVLLDYILNTMSRKTVHLLMVSPHHDNKIFLHKFYSTILNFQYECVKKLVQ